MSGPGQTFGQVAHAYERFRFGYPEAVADRVLGYADGPIRTAVEIGAGTGKATRLFARRDIAVTATDPDPDMLTVLARVCRGLPVATVVSAFEILPPRPPVDLLYAAAALHWTLDEGRWERAATLLRPGGTFASFAAPLVLADPELEVRVETAVGRIIQAAHQTRRDPDPDGLAWPGTELRTAPQFADVAEVRLPQRIALSAKAYVDNLSTTSGFLALDRERRAAGLDELRHLLPSTVEVVNDVVLHLARRR
ncbi:MAG: class I SAM-dependent methyltransferase [Propionibacteriaceae bacterium]